MHGAPWEMVVVYEAGGAEIHECDMKPRLDAGLEMAGNAFVCALVRDPANGGAAGPDYEACGRTFP